MNTERPDEDDAAREPERTDSDTSTDSDSGTGTDSGTDSDSEETAAEKTAVAAEAPEAEVTEVAETGPDDRPDADEPVVAAARVEETVAGDAEVRRPRRSPVLIASVAAAVLLVGGGGALLGSQATGGSGAGAGVPAGDATPDPLVLDDVATDGGNGIAPGEPDPAGVRYEAADELPAGPGSAPVYWAKGEVTADEVTGLAKALGVEGTPALDGAVWKVGSGDDGSGPVLRVNQRAPGMWTFSRYAPGTDDCSGGLTKCAKDPVSPAGTPVSEAVAEKAAAPVLKAVGQDTAKIDASQVMGAQRVVNADPEISGLPTYGWTTGISVGADGTVVGGNGQLKAPAKGQTYPLLSAREALDALNSAPGTDHRMGIGGCASPVPLKDRLESPCGSASSPAGTPQRETVTVEDAVLGLAQHVSDGRQVLVPTWLFEVKGAGAAEAYRVTGLAVDPQYLASAATSAPTAPAPSGETASRDVKVNGYTAEGDELVVSFTGGVCADYAATAKASGDQVKVTVTETPWPDRICVLIAKDYQRTVKLDAPLGDRKVVGTDGKDVPVAKTGARLPQ